MCSIGIPGEIDELLKKHLVILLNAAVNESEVVKKKKAGLEDVIKSEFWLDDNYLDAIKKEAGSPPDEVETEAPTPENPEHEVYYRRDGGVDEGGEFESEEESLKGEDDQGGEGSIATYNTTADQAADPKDGREPDDATSMYAQRVSLKKTDKLPKMFYELSNSFELNLLGS